MRLEEKLSNFQESCIEAAQAKAEAQITEHQAALDKIFAGHKEVVKRQAAAELAAEKEKVKRELNKQLSTEQLHIKRSLSKKNAELKDKLFAEVRAKLHAFKDTPEYVSYLERNINETLDFAGKDELTLYLDASDEHLKKHLEQATGTSLTLSPEPFEGGICAIIPEKHILIDHTFLTLLQDEQESFVFHGGIAHA